MQGALLARGARSAMSAAVASALALLALATTSTPSAPQGPRFSWDTLPVFFHGSNASGPVNPAALALMARFSIVTVEKFQGPCGWQPDASPKCDQEAQIIAVLKGVKEINPNVSTVFYLNSEYDFPQYRLHSRMLQDPSLMLRNSSGGLATVTGTYTSAGTEFVCDVFDFTNPKVWQLFIEECMNATATGYVDGCFIDYAVDGWATPERGLSAEKIAAYEAGHYKMITDLQRKLGDGPLVANHAYGPPHDPMKAGSVSFSMIEGFGASYGYNLSIQELLINADHGRGTLAHASGTEDDLAAFLIGAHHRAYYGVGGWCDNSSDFSGHWMDQFELPLGNPLGAAVYDAASSMWSRKFASGVNVSFAVGTNKGTIAGWQLPVAPRPTWSGPRGCKTDDSGGDDTVAADDDDGCITGKWTISDRPPPHCTPYPNGLFQKRLPNWGKGGPTDHLAPNSAAIAFNSLLMGEYPNGTQNPVYRGDNHLATTGGLYDNSNPIYYGTAADPLYKVVNCREPGHDPAHNPLGTYWHIPANASYSGGADDMFFNVWDQTTNRVLSSYTAFQTSDKSLGACNASTREEACPMFNMSVCTMNDWSTDLGYTLPGPPSDPARHRNGAGDSLDSAPAAMIVRIDEWMAGEIKHAIYLNTMCESTGVVFPAPGSVPPQTRIFHGLC